MKFNVTVDRDEDGIWIAECPAIPGCVSQGKTKDEALDNIREAIALCLEVRAEKELPPTDEQRIELDRRLDAYESDKIRGPEASEVLTALKKRL